MFPSNEGVQKQVSQKFAHPPVVERFVTVVGEIPEETYASRIENWKAIVLPEYPVYEPLTQWNLHFDQRGSEVVVDPTKGQLIIIPRCSKKKESEGFDWSIRTPPKAFTMNMHSDPEVLRAYEDLRGALQNWLPRWVTHFDVRKFERVQMGYVNIMTAEKMPAFSRRAGYLDLDRILKIFVNIPGVHKSLIPPLNCVATVSLEYESLATLRMQLIGLTEKTVGVRLDLSTDVIVTDNSLDAVFKLIHWSHDRIIERFSSVFTDEALLSFGPIK